MFELDKCLSTTILSGIERHRAAQVNLTPVAPLLYILTWGNLSFGYKIQFSLGQCIAMSRISGDYREDWGNIYRC